MDLEMWRPVRGWDGLYEVSSHGRVRSLDRLVHYPDGRRSYLKPGRILGWRSRGYGRVVLVAPGRQKYEAFVHDLVLEAFVGPRPDGAICCHWDDNKQNNHVSNLRWGTYSTNMHDRVRNGIHHARNRKHCKKCGGELTFISEGRRGCVPCIRKYKREDARRRNGHQPRVYWKDMTECCNGHPITPQSTYINPTTGYARCRICRDDAVGKHKARKRLERAR